MPLLKSLGFLPTMPQLNYKISALEQVLDAPELQQTEDAFHGKDAVSYTHLDVYKRQVQRRHTADSSGNICEKSGADVLTIRTPQTRL